jgi:hypothetical protein
MLFYAVTTPALEPLGWQVLAGASAVSTACAAAGWWARTQTARAAAGIYEVLAAPEAAGSTRSDTSELA